MRSGSGSHRRSAPVRSRAGARRRWRPAPRTTVRRASWTVRAAGRATRPARVRGPRARSTRSPACTRRPGRRRDGGCRRSWWCRRSALVGVDQHRLAVEVLVGRPDHLDVTEAFGLVEFDRALLEQLEQGEEADDHLDALGEVGGEAAERDAPGPGQLVEQLPDGIGDGRRDRVDVVEVDHRHGLGCECLDRRVAQPGHAGALQHVGHHGVEALVGADDPREALVGVVGEAREHLGDVFEGLGLEQPGEEHVALLPQGQFVVEVDVGGVRQQTPRLQFHQGGGDQQESRGHVEVEFLHPLDLGQVGVDDGRQVDLVDVDLLLEDQLQQHVERAFVDRGCDVVGHQHANLPEPMRRIGVSSSPVTHDPQAASPRVLSCMQPTGDVHLGNYLGALRNWVVGQHTCDAFHGIVDLHALTVTEEPGVLGDQTVSLAAMFFAIGLDPDVATVFVQSHVPEHSQLGWIMECTVSYGELSRMTQFKDKTAKRENQFISAGLFTYPALQAADILLYDADEVPVGDDQRQHVEITRDVAIRFNHRFGDTFVVPEAVTPAAGARVMSLQDPTSKMSKSDESDAGCVYLVDDPKAVLKKFKRAVTDSDTGPDAVRYDRVEKPGVANLLEIHAAVTGRTPQSVAEDYEQYGKLKVDTAEVVLAVLDPIRTRYFELLDDRGELARLLRVGADKAREVASATLERAHTNIGMLPA